MQWHTTYAAEIYARDRQKELRAMANTAHREARETKREKRGKKTFSNLFRRAKVDIRATSENLTPVGDAS